MNGLPDPKLERHREDVEIERGGLIGNVFQEASIPQSLSRKSPTECDDRSLEW